MRRPLARRRGSVLIEFALISLVLYLLLAATIEFGRVMVSAQAVQSAADLGARELAKVPLDPTWTFEQALDSPAGKRIYDKDQLVIGPGEYLDKLGSAEFPIVNKQLLPLFIVDTRADGETKVLRYPGQWNEATGEIDIPVENGDPLPVVEEVKTAEGESFFGLVNDAIPAESKWMLGMVALRVNYPFQAATMTGFRRPPNSNKDPFDPNIGPDRTIPAAAPRPGRGDDFGAYGGIDGLGRQAALGREVRPFRKILPAQAFARRELFQ